VVGCCECGDEPSGSCTTELVSYLGSGSTTCNIKKLLIYGSTPLLHSRTLHFPIICNIFEVASVFLNS
jgi:hypothetical protein